MRSAALCAACGDNLLHSVAPEEHLAFGKWLLSFQPELKNGIM